MDRDAAYGPDNLADGCVPTVLAGICVQIGSKPAALLAVRRDRTVAQVPVMHAPAAVTVQVTVNCGQPTALRSNAIPAPVQPAAPEPSGQATLTLTGLGLTDPALDSGQIPGDRKEACR